jgi:hypothetical protein
MKERIERKRRKETGENKMKKENKTKSPFCYVISV